MKRISSLSLAIRSGSGVQAEGGARASPDGAPAPFSLIILSFMVIRPFWARHQFGPFVAGAITVRLLAVFADVIRAVADVTIEFLLVAHGDSEGASKSAS